MKIFFYLIQFIFIKIFFIILKLLPLSLSKSLSSTIFRTLGKLSSANKTAIENCKFVFPKSNDNEVIKIIDDSWKNIGQTVCELLRLGEILNEKNIILKGLDNIEEVKKNKSQAIFISIHQSNWEILLPTLDRQGLRIGAIYRHINNIFLDKLVFNLRKKTLKSNLNFYTPKGKKSAKDLMEAIKNNFSIVLLIDQKDSAGKNILFIQGIS